MSSWAELFNMKHLEKERRFLIKFPLSPEITAQLNDPINPAARIIQVYLKNESGLVERVRAISMEIGASRFKNFFHTIKKHVSPGISEEDENEISAEQYENLLQRADEKRQGINKVRYYLDYQGKHFELDIFLGEFFNKPCLVILEIELDDLSEKIELPPHLEIVEEITGKPEYSNYMLSMK